MSPELETLDQLLGGDLPLDVVRSFYSDCQRFKLALLAMLKNNELKLLGPDGMETPAWKWAEVLSLARGDKFLQLHRVSITEIGAKRVH